MEEWTSEQCTQAVRGYLAAQADDKANSYGARRDNFESDAFLDGYDLWWVQGRHTRQERTCH